MALPKNRKASDRNILDEAPLFAGLEGFVIQPQQKDTPDALQKKAPVKRQPKKPAEPARKAVDKSSSTPPAVRKTASPAVNDAGAILLSIRDMCTLLKISRATLVRMDNAGKIPGRMKLGGSVRFHRATVETWLRSLIAPCAPPEDIPF